MKNVLFLTIIVLFLMGMAFAGDDALKHQSWFVDSYNYGLGGHPCSEIYINYGTDTWTFNADDPTLLKVFYEACRAGEGDRLSGESNLSRLLDAFIQNREQPIK